MKLPGYLLSGVLALGLLASSCARDNPPTAPQKGPAEPHRTGRSVTLQVIKSGTGTGTVASSPSGINCGSTCSKSFSTGTVVTLTATPAAGSVFAGWSGGGTSGTGNATITLNANTTVTATFNTSGGGGETFTLTVNKIQLGAGAGTVTSTPAGINCGSTCTASFPAGASITLSASPTAGKFIGWSGDACSGTSPTCTFTLNSNMTVSAQFNLVVITDNSLPNGNVGADYTAFISSCCGSGSPDNFSIVAGSLPSGLTMAQNFGVQSTIISGRPTREETKTFTVRVQDQSGSTTKTLSITIGPPVPLVITMPEGSTATPGTVGSAYLQNLFASGGTTPYTWSISAGSLPPGLSLVSAQNGNRITGTPTTAGTFTFTLTVRDSGGQQASRQVSITIS